MKPEDVSTLQQLKPQPAGHVPGVAALSDGSPPTFISVPVLPDTDRELQTLYALVGIMEHFYPQKRREISDAFEMWRISEYFHSRFGVKPEHVNA